MQYIRSALTMLVVVATSHSAELTIWAGSGEDKVTRDELRATSGADVSNAVWDGTRISIAGARNEVVACNLVLEAPDTTVDGVSIVLDGLTGPGGHRIEGRPVDSGSIADDLFRWTGRDIELFYVRYLQIRGLSELSYPHYDERHIPVRFQRPYDQWAVGQGTWYDRPDHDTYYPEIAVPLELHPQFSVAGGGNQSIWIDIYIDKDCPPGLYAGELVVQEVDDHQRIPVELQVYAFTLPDLPTARTMLVGGEGSNVHRRYVGEDWPNHAGPAYQRSLEVSVRHCQMAHRHKISLLHDYGQRRPAAVTYVAVDNLTGDMFTADGTYAVNSVVKSYDYDGIGEGVGSNVYSIGTYGHWRGDWFEGLSTEEEQRQAMWERCDEWQQWFDDLDLQTPTETFVYLIDESHDTAQTERWASWMASNPGIGAQIRSMATINTEHAANEIPSLDIANSWQALNCLGGYDSAAASYTDDPDKRLYFYNGVRQQHGSFATEDEGVSLVVTAWAQYKLDIDRWFFWESTYYNDYQSDSGQTNLFQNARTYGVDDRFEETGAARGRTGWNYCNGDGVLFYPGTDLVYPEESYGINGPIASLRLKYWRRGIQDADYLAMAEAIDPVATRAIIDRMIPLVLWEYGPDHYDRAGGPDDPTWASHDISWSIDPDAWQQARAELAAIIGVGETPTRRVDIIVWRDDAPLVGRVVQLVDGPEQETDAAGNVSFSGLNWTRDHWFRIPEPVDGNQ
jgi:hypothetical protein